jgi:hypothetical protein
MGRARTSPSSSSSSWRGYNRSFTHGALPRLALLALGAMAPFLFYFIVLSLDRFP